MPIRVVIINGLLLESAYRSHADGLYGCGTILSGWMMRQFRALAGVFKTGRQAAAGVAAGAKGAVELFAGLRSSLVLRPFISTPNILRLGL